MITNVLGLWRSLILFLCSPIFPTLKMDYNYGNNENNYPLLLNSSLHFSKDFQKQCIIYFREAAIIIFIIIF